MRKRRGIMHASRFTVVVVALLSSAQGFSSVHRRPRQPRRSRVVCQAAGDSSHRERQREIKTLTTRHRRGEPDAADTKAATTTTTAASRRQTRQQYESTRWMKQLFDHELLTKEEEQRLGRAIQRAAQLRDALDAVLRVKKEEQLLHQLERERLDNFHDDWDDDDEDLANLSVYGFPDEEPDRYADEVREERWYDSEMEGQQGHGHYLNNLDLLTDTEIKSLLSIPGGRSELEGTLQEGSDARQKLLHGNVRLVVSIARRFSRQRKGIGTAGQPSFEEVIQEGIVGLVTAVDRYRPEMNYRFATYGTWWIANSVRKCFQSYATGLRLPVSYHITKGKYQKIVKRYLDMEGKLPQLDLIAKELDVSVDRLETVLRKTQQFVSTDAPKGFNNKGGTGSSDASWDLLDDFVDKQVSRPEDCVDLSFLRQSLENAMAAELAPHERDVIRLRLGLDDGLRRTTRQVAQEFSMLSILDVQHIERSALKKLRSPHSLSTYKLLTFMGLVGVDQKTVNLR